MKAYADLVQEVSITITPSDATFLAALVNQYIARGNDTEHLRQLVAQLTPKVGA